MYINQYLLKECGGDLKVQESIVGEGTTIIITVPALPSLQKRATDKSI